ncbi:MAG: hypothetical protein PHW03_02810 [Eubacteriales bacterium]|nr:hypothetical protein [Eubacteriales bacterium]
MKFIITFKTPDVLEDLDRLEDISEEERSFADELVKQYVEYGEYIRIEFDTEAKTAKVLRK